MRKFISATAAILVLAAFTVFYAHAQESAGTEITVSAQSAVLMEASTGTVFYEKEPDRRALIASTTKLMTALVAIENASLNETVTVPAACESVEGSSMYLKAGEELSLRELLYGLMLESGNDAAVAVACHVGGSVDGFVKLMNYRAASLGLENTHFVNPHGLNAEEHYSTARDLALIMRECMENPVFAQIASTRTVTFGGRTFTNHNKLMWSCEGVVAGKTGYTKKAGRTLVTCAERDGMRLICVTLNDGDDWTDHAALYDMGFSRWQIQTPVRAGDTLAELPVISGTEPSVKIVAAKGVSVLAERGAALKAETSLPAFVYAQVRAGERAGTLSVTLDGRPAGETELVFAADVPRDESQRIRPFERIRRTITGFFCREE